MSSINLSQFFQKQSSFSAASQYYIHAAYCYRWTTIVCLSVCHNCKQCTTERTNPDVVF